MDAGRAPKTINGELATLRQVLKHARLWYRLEEGYRPLKNTKPPVGQAISDDEQYRLFEAARTQESLNLITTLFPWHGKNKKIDPTKPMTRGELHGDLSGSL